MTEPPVVAVCIPFASTDSWRNVLLDAVLRRWDQCFPEWPIYISATEPFTRGGSRNEAARAAGAVDVLVFCDADTLFVDPAGIERAVLIAARGGWVLPELYQESRPWTNEALDADEWPEVLPSPDRHELSRQFDASPGGIQVMPRAAWEAVGGWPDWDGWSYEDDAMRLALDMAWKPHDRYGHVMHLWHERPATEYIGSPAHVHNRARYESFAKLVTDGIPVAEAHKRADAET